MFPVRGWHQYSGMESFMANSFAAWTEFMAMENPPILLVIPCQLYTDEYFLVNGVTIYIQQHMNLRRSDL